MNSTTKKQLNKDRIDNIFLKDQQQDLIIELFEAISETFNGGVIITDINGGILIANSLAEELLNRESPKPYSLFDSFGKEEGNQLHTSLNLTITEQEKTKLNTSIRVGNIHRKISIHFSPVKSCEVALGLISFIEESDSEAGLFRKVLDLIPADIALFDSEFNYLFVNKSAVHSQEVRRWLIGKNDHDYCCYRGLSRKIADERVYHLKNVLENGYSEFIETFAGPSSNENTWSNRKLFSFTGKADQKFILGYGVPIEVGKRDHNRFLEVLNSLNESVLELDFEGRFILYNEAWKNLVGLNSQIELESHLVDYVHEGDKMLFLSYFRSIKNDSQQEQGSIPIRIKARTGFLWIEIKISKKEFSQKASSVYCIIKDIDEAKKSYETINQLRLAVEDSAEGIAIMSSPEKYTYLNKAHVELFGYTHAEELIGKSWKAIYPPDEIERIEKEVFPEFMAKGHYRGPTKGLKKDGTNIFQEISLTALPNGGLICVTHNITEELKQEKKLRQLAIVAEKTNSLILICDKRGRLEWVNKSFEELTQYKLEEIKGLFPSDILAGPETDKSVIKCIQDSVKHAKCFKGEILNYSKHGEKFWLYLDITPILDDTNQLQGFIAVENNITTVKVAEEKLVFALNKEKQLNSLKSHFINLVSHEFRTPLATIQSSMDILDVMCGKHGSLENESMKKIFYKHHFRIENEIGRMTKIMDNVLLLGRIDAARVIIKKESLFLDELINEIVNEFIQYKKVAGEFKVILKGVRRKNDADPFLIRQVIMNVIMNAIKYDPNNAPPLIKINYKKSCSEIEVSDKGIGIPEEELPNIFKSFFRASNTQHIQGTGLGLVIVKQLVEMHNGFVQISNNKIGGITVKITLPYYL